MKILIATIVLVIGPSSAFAQDLFGNSRNHNSGIGLYGTGSNSSSHTTCSRTSIHMAA